MSNLSSIAPETGQKGNNKRMMYALAVIGTVALLMFPVIYLWCIKPGKSIQDGLRDWLDESAEDI